MCLDQSTASGITQKEDDHFKESTTQALVGLGGIFLVVVGSLAFAAQMYNSKKYLKNKLYEMLTMNEIVSIFYFLMLSIIFNFKLI